MYWSISFQAQFIMKLVAFDLLSMCVINQETSGSWNGSLAYDKVMELHQQDQLNLIRKLIYGLIIT